MARFPIPLLFVVLGALGAVACSGDIAAPDGAVEEEDGAADDDGGVVQDDGERVQDDGTPDGSDQGGPVGALSAALRVDHLGWRPGDPKQAVLLGHAGEAVELRRTSDQGVAGSYTAGGLASDEDSGDQIALVDFSAFSAPGEYYLLLPGAGLRSYPFRVAGDVYDVAGEAAMKSFYFQRCNHDKALPYAGDVLHGQPGLGGRWVDGACHPTDASAPAGPGSADHGALDVRGGWHDAGDYQKTLWGRGVPEMLWAQELHPGAWRDGQLNLPESGNGVPDILDELGWELDFYVRMQRPDGHFMSSAKGRDATVTSPPSASDEGRVYFDCTSPDGGGWSGGGVTVGQATGNAVLSLAHAAIVFRAAGDTQRSDGYAAAALAGWAWLAAYAPQDDQERRVRAAAAAAIYRLDPGQATARSVVEAFPWDAWDGLLPWDVTPSENTIAAGAWHVLANPSASAALQAEVSEAVRQALVEGAFSEAGAYGGMFGGPGNPWDWSWGSNRQQSSYGANLMLAAHFGALGGRSRAEVETQAQRYLHFILGLNPLRMVYLTNMAAYGAEHSSFQPYHCWFSFQGGDGDHGNPDYNGKPAGVDEPAYPYHPDDSQTSTYGPAPGLVVGGPNPDYSCSYDIPNQSMPAYAYRDFSVGCDWDGGQCLACSWEITEPMAAYQGPFVLLVSFFMSNQ